MPALSPPVSGILFFTRNLIPHISNEKYIHPLAACSSLQAPHHSLFKHKAQ